MHLFCIYEYTFGVKFGANVRKNEAHDFYHWSEKRDLEAKFV